MTNSGRKAPTEKAGVATDKLWIGAFFIFGCVLVFAGFAIRGLDIGTCPVMGYNGVVASCIHTFPGTDIPITTGGNMVMTIGAVLIVATLVLFLYERTMASKVSK